MIQTVFPSAEISLHEYSSILLINCLTVKEISKAVFTPLNGIFCNNLNNDFVPIITVRNCYAEKLYRVSCKIIMNDSFSLCVNASEMVDIYLWQNTF